VIQKTLTADDYGIDDFAAKAISMCHSQSPDENRDDCAAAEQRRSDEHLVNLGHWALHRTGYDQLCRLNIHCHEGHVTLHGRVASYYLKQIAQEALRSVASPRHIENQIVVDGNPS
jgi:osmotically-inducible protein OsmY